MRHFSHFSQLIIYIVGYPCIKTLSRITHRIHHHTHVLFKNLDHHT